MKHSACFIGHRTVEETENLQTQVQKTVENLVERGVVNFIFGDHSAFTALCYDVVTELKEKHPAIRRIHFRTEYGDADEYTMQFLMSGFEESVCPKGVENAGRARYVERDQAMIRESDVCVLYYDEQYRPSRRKSGTAAAFIYAKKQNKGIVNLFEK